jgi:hypothetical protein
MTKAKVLALFGESERGEFDIPILCSNLQDLLKKLGNPPPDSFALHYAVQAIHYNHDLLFFRVREEGYSYQDYLGGLELLEHTDQELELQAICAPGVGDSHLIDAIFNVCAIHQSLLITSERDLYDYLSVLVAKY